MKNTAIETIEPKLAAPGAGLPFLESLYARYVLYPKGMRDFVWEKSLGQLASETEKITSLAQMLSDDAFRRRVLIERLRGLEDSSRNWSVSMTIEHLIITMNGMTAIARDLARGKALDVEVSTAGVKPSPQSVLSKEALLDNLRKVSDATQKLLMPFAGTADNKNKVAHPFFGPIPAKGWVWVLGIHQALHRAQVEKIIEGIEKL